MTENAEKSSPTVSNGEGKTNKKKKKRSPLLAAAIVLVLIIIVVLITLAFFTSFDEVTNVFGGGKVDITLTEPNWKPAEALNIVPNTVLDKDPYITNNEDTAVYVFLEVAVPYGTIGIEYDDLADKGRESLGSPFEKAPLYKFGISDETSADAIFDTDYYLPNQLVNSGWLLLHTGNNEYTEIDEDNKVYKYVYAHVQVENGSNTNRLSPLAKGWTTGTPLFNKIKLVNFDENYTATENYSVPVKAYGIQADFLTSDNTNDPYQVWSILNGN